MCLGNSIDGRGQLWFELFPTHIMDEVSVNFVLTVESLSVRPTL
jgi:hypothetical protein